MSTFAIHQCAAGSVSTVDQSLGQACMKVLYSGKSVLCSSNALKAIGLPASNCSLSMDDPDRLTTATTAALTTSQILLAGCRRAAALSTFYLFAARPLTRQLSFFTELLQLQLLR